MKIRSTPWTVDDNRRLKKAVQAGVSAARATVIYNRSIVSIHEQARQIGTAFPSILDEKRARDAKIEAATKTSEL